jgi:hypothetical protein
MWGLLYLVVIGFAAGMTTLYLLERAVVFASAASMTAWLILAYDASVELVSNGSTTTLDVGPIRWLWLALGLLSLIALVGAIFGYYPESETPTEEAYQV